MLAGGTLLPQLWVALVIQLPSACLEGARPGLGEGGGVRVREGRGRGIITRIGKKSEFPSSILTAV